MSEKLSVIQVHVGLFVVYQLYPFSASCGLFEIRASLGDPRHRFCFNVFSNPLSRFRSCWDVFYLKETNKDDQFNRIKSLRPSPNHQRRASSRDGYALLEQEHFQNPQDKRPIHVPFIPEVHMATFTLQEVEYAKIISSQASSIVTRKSRVSTESHPSQLMEEFLHNEEFESLGSDLVNRLADSDKSGIEKPPEQ